MMFSPIDLTSSLDVEAQIAAMPETCTSKGMFMKALHDQVEALGVELPPKRYAGFSNYPLADNMRLCVMAAEKLHPQRPLRYGLYHLGQQAYPVFVKSTVGKVMRAVAGSSFQRALEMAGRAYEHSMKPGSVEVKQDGDHRAEIRLRDIWNFADCYQVGVFVGALEAFGGYGEARVRCITRCDVDLELTWR